MASFAAFRTWVTGEVVTAAQLNEQIRDNGINQRGSFNKTQRTSASYTINGTSWADLDTGLDHVHVAAAGDLIEVALDGMWGNEAVDSFLDVIAVTSGTHFGAGGASGNGVIAWWGLTGAFTPFGGSFFRELVSGDISAGNVTLRLRRRTNTATNKLLLAADANRPLTFFSRNHGSVL